MTEPPTIDLDHRSYRAEGLPGEPVFVGGRTAGLGVIAWFAFVLAASYAVGIAADWIFPTTERVTNAIGGVTSTGISWRLLE